MNIATYLANNWPPLIIGGVIGLLLAWLVTWDFARRQAREYGDYIDSLESELNRREEALAASRKQAEDAEASLLAARTTLKSTEAGLLAARSELKSTEASLQSARSQTVAWQNKCAALEKGGSALAAKELALAEATERAAGLEHELSVLRDELAQATMEKADLADALAARDLEMAGLAEQLAARDVLEADLRESFAQRQDTLRHAQEQLDHLQAQLAAAQMAPAAAEQEPVTRGSDVAAQALAGALAQADTAAAGSDDLPAQVPSRSIVVAPGEGEPEPEAGPEDLQGGLDAVAQELETPLDDHMAPSLGVEDQTQPGGVEAVRSAARRLTREPDTGHRLWDGHRVDDFEALGGIGTVYEQRLYETGIYTYEQLAATSAEDLQACVSFPKGRRPNFADWIEQAAELVRQRQSDADGQPAEPA